MCVLPAPVMLFSMDVIERNILIGHLNGTLQGDPGILPGIRGNALYFDGLPGSRVVYGVHTEGCFFDPHQCDQGITLSIWLVSHETSSRFQIIFDSGGCNKYGIGFCIYFDGSRRSHSLLSCICGNAAALPETQLRAAGAANAANAASASRAPIRSTIGSIKAQWTIYWTQVTQQAQPAQPAQLVQPTQQTQPAHPELQFEVL